MAEHWRIAALIVCTVAAPAVIAQVVPPAASPGGALPELPVEAPAAPAAPPVAFPIPPSVDRPLDAEEGDRLFVDRFVLEGVDDRPDQGILKEEIEGLIEDLRVERQGLNQVDDSGFTVEEKAQITDFMRKVVDDPDLDMGFEAYEVLVDKLRTDKSEREAGLTIGQMQQIANAVTEYYRSAGFILAQAFIPAQEVSEGKIAIRVQEGTLGNVIAEGNERYSDEVLARPFEDLVDSPVTAASIESAVLAVSDYPGLSVFGVFQPGTDVGTADIALRVQDEKRFDANLRLDNHGTRFTGTRRVFADFAWNNPTGAGDRAIATALRQYRPKNSFFGQLEYERPILPGISVGGTFQRNPFSVAGELRAAELSGETTSLSTYVRRSFIRSRPRNLAGTVTWRRSKSLTKQNKRQTNLDHVSAVEGELAYDSIDSESRAINVATFGASYGLGERFGGKGPATLSGGQNLSPSRTGASGKVADSEFLKLTGSYSRLQTLTQNQSLLVRLDAQWANDILTSLDQFSIGGPNSVRAFTISEKLVDTGGFASAEWTMKAPGFSDEAAFKGYTWGQVLSVSFFSDFAWGRLRDVSASEEEFVNLAGWGAGVSLNVPGMLQGRVQWAHPFGQRVPGDGDRGHWWFDLTYQF